jgi:hypothetical protein
VSPLLEELVREHVRALSVVVSRRKTANPDARDATDAVRMVLRDFEDVKVMWERYCEMLATGLDAGQVRDALRAAMVMFDEWLVTATSVGQFAESVTHRTGSKVVAWDEFRGAVEQVKAVKESAGESLQFATESVPNPPAEAIAEARALREQGKFKNFGAVLATLLAKKS